MNFLAIEIGGSKLQLVTGTVDGEIVDRQRWDVERERGGEGIRERIETTVADLQRQFQWRAVGVGYGGPIEWKTGRVFCSHHVEGWDDFPLGDWLREITGLSVAIDNDTNVAAFGEANRGAGIGFNPVFYTNSGSGVGGGLVVDGKIYHGAFPGEAEIGHLRLDNQGTIIEERCSGWAVDRKILELTKREPSSALAREHSVHHGARALAPALRANCPFARQILHETAGDLAVALSHVVHLLHPEVIVLGGGLSLIGEPWREAVAEALPPQVMKAFAPGPKIKITNLAEDAVLVGALLLAEKTLS